jgi:hypothetical protein
MDSKNHAGFVMLAEKPSKGIGQSRIMAGVPGNLLSEEHKRHEKKG